MSIEIGQEALQDIFLGEKKKQHLKEISSFEPTKDQLLEGRFWWGAPPLLSMYLSQGEKATC